MCAVLALESCIWKGHMHISVHLCCSGDLVWSAGDLNIAFPRARGVLFWGVVVVVVLNCVAEQGGHTSVLGYDVMDRPQNP